MNFFNITITLAIIALSPSPATAQQPPRPIEQFTSSNIFALAGGGDTLWAASERWVNYRAPVNSAADGKWPGYALNAYVYDVAFGGGGAAVFIADWGSYDPYGFWYFSHAGGAQPRLSAWRFSPALHESDSAYLVNRAVFKAGSFWAPFNWGGMVRFNPAGAGAVQAIMPGENGAAGTPPSALPFDMSQAGGRDSAKVLAVADSGAGGLLVTTPYMLLSYNIDSQIWDTSGRAAALPDGERFVRFNSAVTLRKGGLETVYSLISAAPPGGDTSVSLYRLAPDGGRWHRALGAAFDNRRIAAVYPIDGGGLYVFFSEGNDRISVSLFADTSSAGLSQEARLSEILTHEKFREELAKAGRGPPDPNIQDILFLPRAGGGTSGTLAVAATAGLYICASADPVAGIYGGPWRFENSAREVRKNEAYALPGIMRTSYDGLYDKSVFVYGLKKRGKVTIRVYDYNMSLVKTVVKGRDRPAGNRSTAAAEDVWDGTNNSSKPVWPGVYYFKITSTGGERFFGKVIVAK